MEGACAPAGKQKKKYRLSYHRRHGKSSRNEEENRREPIVKTNETTAQLTDREWIHRLVDVIDDAYLDEVKWLVQPFAAKSLNEQMEDRKYRKE